MNNFLDTLYSVLRKDTRLIAEDGTLLKNKAYALAMQIDPTLIQVLLENEDTKKHFFTEVGSVLVFDKVKFGWVVNNREFLPDSYTRYKNKIGLVDGNEVNISNTKDVVLVWPYKDCVLEGGQTEEEQSRSEIFYNELLAPDEIDRLLYPKVFTNACRYTKDDDVPVGELLEKDNLLIKGNNLLALGSLLKRYEGKVKLIYIDPPYNTEGDEFKYNDKFNHSTWLTFMKNRLEFAKKLLIENGVIFIHIGDQEMHYLKVLADDVFGRDKFVATVPRKTRNGKSDVPYKMSQDYDWMLVYTNARTKTVKLFQRTVERKYYQTPDFPNDEWRMSDLTKQTSIEERQNSNFTLVNPRNGDKYPVNPNRSWAITIDTVDDYIRRKKIVFPGDYEFLNITQPAMRVFKSEEIDKHGDDFDKAYVSTEFLNKAMDTLLKSATNKRGTDEMVELFGEKAFSYPKNELLLKLIIEYCTKESDIVMDFFMGSGTTCAVAHKMNRQYIGVEQMGYIKTVTIERMKKVIGGEQGGISKDVNWEGGGSFVYCELKELNQQYVDKVQDAKNEEELLAVWQEIAATGFISHYIRPSDVDTSVKAFEELSFENKKRLFLELIDKNMLYVNLCDIDDEKFSVSDDDKAFNRSFYGRD